MKKRKLVTSVLFIMFCTLFFPNLTYAQINIQESEPLIPNNNIAEANATMFDFILPHDTIMSGSCAWLTMGDPFDYWKFTLPQDGSVSITFNYTPNNTFGGIMSIGGEGCEFWYQYIYPTSTTVKLGKLSAGNHYLKINGLGAGQWGYFDYNFSITYNIIQVQGDSEPNNSKAEADSLSINSSATGHIGVRYCGTNDFDGHDWYKFTTSAAGNFKATVHLESTEFENGISDELFNLFSESSIPYASGTIGMPLATASINTNTLTSDLVITYNNLSPGTYYLHLRQYGAGCGYTLTDSLFPIISNIEFKNSVSLGNWSSGLICYSGLPTNINTPIKICADGSEATYIKVNASFTSGISLRIIDENGNVQNDANKYGEFITSIDYTNAIEFVFRHPTFMELNQLHRNCTLQILINGSPIEGINFPIHFYRAPVVFIHGLLGSLGTFQSMNNSFVSNSFYPSTLTNNVDYKYTSFLKFSTNRKVIQNAIDKVLLQARNECYSAGKVILVSHSQGGILSRLYLQGTYNDCPYRNDIQKIITINTPHYGTQFANNGLNNLTLLEAALRQLSPKAGIVLSGISSPFLGAVKDLRVNSIPITQQLNIATSLQNKVPSVTLSTNEIGDTNKIAKAFRILFWYAYNIENIYDSEINDLVVPLSSQQSGIALQGTISQQWHVGAAGNSTIINQVRNLINANPTSSSFTQNGFPVNTLQPPVMQSSNPPLVTKTPSLDSIKIISPTSGQLFNPNDIVTVNISATSSINHISLLVYGNSINPIIIDTTNVNQLGFQIPSDAVGALNLILLGGNSSNLLSQDTTRIIVTSTSILDSIKASPDSLKVPLGMFTPVTINGYFNGIQNEINLQGLSGLSITYDTTFLYYDGNSSFKGLTLGTTNIIYAYQGKADTVNIVIENNTLALTSSFDYSSESICANSTVAFHEQSLGLATAYQWSFPGGVPSTSTLPNPIITYPISGTYPVSLKTTFVNGVDSLLIDNLIKVNPIPTVTITGNNIICSGAIVTLTANTTPLSGNIIAYQWKLNGNNIVGATNGSYNTSLVGNYSVDVANDGGCTSTSSDKIITTGICDTLNLKLYLQGYYTSSSMMSSALMNQGVNTISTITDTIIVELRNANSPYEVVSSGKAILNTNGTSTFVFPTIQGSYYIAIKHRNGIQTWSSQPILFATPNVSYDFSTNANKTYGNNQIEVDMGIWGMYSGDINLDENIDLLDLSDLEFDASNFSFGYFATDLNGDGNVDLLDSPILEANVNNFIFSSHP